MKKLLALISILLFLAIPITYAYAAQIDEVKAAIAKSGLPGWPRRMKFLLCRQQKERRYWGPCRLKGCRPVTKH